MPSTGLAPTSSTVYGVLSLIVWSLILIVSVKYIVFVMRLDDRGEGGIGHFGRTPISLAWFGVVFPALLVVASQAHISSAFSLTQQCVQLHYSPRVSIVHT